MQWTGNSQGLRVGSFRIIYDPFARLYILHSFIFVSCVLFCFYSPDELVKFGGWHVFFLSSLSFLFIYFRIAPPFLSSPGVRGAIMCLWLVYEEHWFAQWGLACSYREGGKVNEYATCRPSTSLLYSKILPLSFLLSTCSSALSCHTFLLVCVYVRESVLV